MIQTVNGSLKKMGITMSHEHLILDLRNVRKDEDSYIFEIDLVVSELLKAKTFGVDTIIELTCNDMGRDCKKLQEISTLTDINIICSTGFYLKQYHTDFVKTKRMEEIQELFEKEIVEGIEDTNIKAGIIGEIGCSKLEIDVNEQKVLTASGNASVKTNAAVSTHCDAGLLGMEHLRILLKTGMNSDKIILGHTDLTGDVPYQIALLQSGANLAFDTLGKSAYLSDDIRLDCICQLLDKGYEKKILLSQDVSKKSYLTSEGGNGYSFVMEHFIPRLLKRGVSQSEIDNMLMHNPKRILEME